MGERTGPPGAARRTRIRQSARFGLAGAVAERWWWHHLPGQGALGRDHDERPVAGSDREGFGISPFENAQHVGDLISVI